MMSSRFLFIVLCNMSSVISVHSCVIIVQTKDEYYTISSVENGWYQYNKQEKKKIVPVWDRKR